MASKRARIRMDSRFPLEWIREAEAAKEDEPPKEEELKRLKPPKQPSQPQRKTKEMQHEWHLNQYGILAPKEEPHKGRGTKRATTKSKERGTKSGTVKGEGLQTEEAAKRKSTKEKGNQFYCL
eukprot:511307_1